MSLCEIEMEKINIASACKRHTGQYVDGTMDDCGGWHHGWRWRMMPLWMMPWMAMVVDAMDDNLMDGNGG